MQEQEARRIREKWGSKPCDHAGLDRLYFGSAHDGYVCIRCGKEFTQQEKEELKDSPISGEKP